MLRAGNAMETFQRIDGDNIRNFGSINFDGKATRLFGYQLGYANSYYNYDDENETEGFLGAVNPSISGLLDRLEHVGHFDTRWQLQPDTVGVLGYQYRQVNYTGDEAIAGSAILGDVIESDDRDSRTHYGYVGVDHSFRPDFTGALRVGAQFTDYFNDDSDDDTDVSPYVLASLKYNYMPESFLEVGYSYDINATDIVGFDPGDGDYTKDQKSSIIYVALTHRITPRLFGTINGQYQNSEFNGGIYDDESEKFYTAGISLEYRFSRHFSAHVGYAYDMLDSDIDSDLTPRDLDRNRVYVGVTAKY
jgi:predicted porin